MIGFTGSAATTAVQVGYPISDIVAKAIFGVLIYVIAALKSETEPAYYPENDSCPSPLYTQLMDTQRDEREFLAEAQMYRDRAGTQNLFDKRKNQWGWTGFSTQDLRLNQLMARMVAQIHNWWSIFTRIGTGRGDSGAGVVGTCDCAENQTRQPGAFEHLQIARQSQAGSQLSRPDQPVSEVVCHACRAVAGRA